MFRITITVFYVYTPWIGILKHAGSHLSRSGGKETDPVTVSPDLPSRIRHHDAPDVWGPGPTLVITLLTVTPSKFSFGMAAHKGADGCKSNISMQGCTNTKSLDP